MNPKHDVPAAVPAEEVHVPEKSPIEKIQDAVNEAVADPEGTARKAADQMRGVLSLGFMVVGQVAQTVADRLMRSASPAPAQTPPAPTAPKPPVVDREQPTPADLARVVELKPAAVKKAAAKAPAKKAPAKKSATPSGKLPIKKAPVKKAPVKKAPVKKAPVKKAVKKTPAKAVAPAKKAPAKKAPAKKAPAKKAPAKKAPAKKSSPRTQA